MRVVTCSSLLLALALLEVGCVDGSRPEQPPVAETSAPLVDAGVARCGNSIASAVACQTPSCLRIPWRCGNTDNPYGQHECVWRFDCADIGNGEPYCIATGSAGGCLCVQRCQSDDQCEEGTICNCTGAKYGTCVAGSRVVQ